MHNLDIEGAGRGVLAAEDLEVGDIALEIPISVIISEDLVYKSDMVCFIWQKGYVCILILFTLT